MVWLIKFRHICSGLYHSAIRERYGYFHFHRCRRNIFLNDAGLYAVSEDTFTIDFAYPMSPIQAFGIALTR